MELKRRGRPVGRNGSNWSGYLAPLTIDFLEKRAADRDIAAGKYLDELIARLRSLEANLSDAKSTLAAIVALIDRP
jgi:hypothetical protein